MPVVRHARRVAALLALMGVLAPCASGVVVALHLSAHHAAELHEDDHDHAADLSVLWHGHSHEATTPEHDHPLLVAGTHALRVPPALQSFPDVPGAWPQDSPFAAALGQRVWRLCPPGLAGLGPPHPGRVAILRI